MQIHNMSLYDAARDFVHKAFSILENEAQSGPSKEIFCWDTSGLPSAETKTVIDWPFLTAILRHTLETTAEYAAFKAQITTDPIISKQLETVVGAIDGQVGVRTAAVIARFVYELAEAEDECIYNETLFDRYYQSFESSFRSAHVEYEVIAPLIGFRTTAPLIELQPNVDIIRITDLMLNRTIHAGIIHRVGSEQTVLHPPSHAVRVRYQLPKLIGPSVQGASDTGLPPEYFEAHELILRVMQALTVFKTGHCTIAGKISFSSAFFLRGMTVISGPSVPARAQNKYDMDAHETGQFKALWLQLQNDRVRGRSFLDTAIRRFRDAAERLNVADKMVDLMITAEALFLSRSADKKQDKLAKRAGVFLETECGMPREDVRTRFSSAYDLRSDIVHGGAAPPGDPLLKAVQDIEHDLRSAIPRFLEVAAKTPIGHNVVDWATMLYGITWNP